MSNVWKRYLFANPVTYAVRLYPKESCSCPASGVCYHILTCKIMIGQNVDAFSNPNMTLLQQKIRRKNKERPSGRKPPRVKDCCPTEEIKQEEPEDLEEKAVEGVADDQDFVSIKEERTENKSHSRSQKRKHPNSQLDTDNSCCNGEQMSCAPKKKLKGATTLVHQTDSSPPQEACVPNHPLTQFLLELKEKASSSAKIRRCERRVKFLNEEFCWDRFLSELNVVCQDILLYNYVLQPSIDKEVTDLDIGKIAVLQTKRSNQIAFLRRLNDKEDKTPRVEVVSSYSDPDYAELNYHAGTATRSNIGVVNTIHVGVQSSKQNAKAEIITAVLLLHICKQPDTDLGKLRIDLVKGLPQLFSVLQQDDTGTVNGISQVKKDYRGKAEEMVQLFCYCQTPWVDGSTSAALYGNSQRDFNMYNCSKCDNWFHKYCLSACDITIPKRNADFFCSACTVPESLPWMHNGYTNTCTSDNFLTILSLHCKQYKSFLDTFGDSEAENSLKAAIVLMNKGKLDEGKTLFLHLLQSRLNLTISQENNLKYDCFGGENNRCLLVHTYLETGN
ncbi:uncharacterized protein [Dysidea avara]|uniref:uncharacterized protein isoform X1 n=2 Tax=Dysidea avara TaxID=196820 RepID=UPI00332C533E